MSKEKVPVVGQENRQFVTALARGLEILRCFDRPRLELSVSEISRLVGLSQPTTWRLCATLVECGFLVRGTKRGALQVGAPVLTLGYAAAKGLGPVDLVRPYMSQLTEITGGNTMLNVQSGVEMISVEQQNGEMVLPNQPVGWRAPLTAIPSGLAVLAAMPDDEYETTLAMLEVADANWERHRKRILDAKAQYEREGVVTLTGMLEGQYSAVAIALFRPGDQGERWALSIGGASARWTEGLFATAAAELKKVAAILRPALAII